MAMWLISELFEKDNPYYLFRANQQQVGTKIYSLTQCSLSVNECDWHIFTVKDERINTHFLTLMLPMLQFSLNVYRRKLMKPGGPAHEIVTKTVHKTVPEDVGGGEVLGGWEEMQEVAGL